MLHLVQAIYMPVRQYIKIVSTYNLDLSRLAIDTLDKFTD